MVKTAATNPDPLPVGLEAAAGAVEALGALFNMVDPEAWNSQARPSAQQIGQLFWLVGARLEVIGEDVGEGASN